MRNHRLTWRQRAALAIASGGMMLQVGCPAGATGVSQDVLQFVAVAVGNLVTNTLSFFLDNLVIRALG
jgi:hypothetical protein